MKTRLKRIIKAYNKLALPLKVTVWYFICSFVNKGVSFLTTPLFTRILSTNDYGTVSVYVSWSQVFVIFVTLGLSNSVINVGLVKFDHDKNHFQTSMLGLLFLWFTFSSVVVLFAYPFVSKYISLDFNLIILLLLDSLTSTVISIWLMRKRLDYDYRSMSVVTLVNAIAGTIISLLLTINMENKVTAKIMGCTIVAVVISFICICDCLKDDRKLIDCCYWKFALKYNIPMIPHFLSGVILNQLDRIMIEKMCGVSYSAIYSVAYNSAAVVIMLNQAVTATYSPWLLKRIKQRDYTGVTGVVNVILFLYLAIICLLMLLAPEIIRIMAPQEYYEGIYIIPPVATSMFFMLLFNIFAPVEHYSLKTKFIGFASIIAAAANILFNYYFIDKFGYLAAGYTTLLCYIIFAITHYAYMTNCCRQMKLNDLFKGKYFLLFSIIAVAMTLICTVLYSYMILRYVFILLVMIVIYIFRKRLKNSMRSLLDRRSF